MSEQTAVAALFAANDIREIFAERNLDNVEASAGLAAVTADYAIGYPSGVDGFLEVFASLVKNECAAQQHLLNAGD